MLKHLTATEISTIMRAGGGATVSASQFTATELATIARAMVGGAVLYVVNSQSLTGTQMATIARAASAPAHVSFSGVPA